MKRKSKLFLIVAGIIFAVGILVCLVAAGISSSTGEQLFAAKIGEDKVYTYKFGDGKTDKIKISVIGKGQVISEGAVVPAGEII